MPDNRRYLDLVSQLLRVGVLTPDEARRSYREGALTLEDVHDLLGPMPSDPTLVSPPSAPPEMDLDWEADDPTVPKVFVPLVAKNYRDNARPLELVPDPPMKLGLWARAWRWLRRTA